MQDRTNVNVGPRVIAALLILFASVGHSQERYASLYLENGDRVTGRWLESDEVTVQVMFQGEKLSVDLDQILTVRFALDASLIPDAIAEKHFRNGKALLDLGLRNEARGQFLRAIEEFPKYADAHYKLGQLLEEDGEAGRALECFGRVARIDSQSYDLAAVFKNAGDRYLESGQYREAVDAYLLLFDHYASHPEAAYAGYTSGFTLYERLDAASEGLKVLQEANRRYPLASGSTRGEFLIGVLLSKVGQPQIAAEKLTQFVQTRPDSQWLDDAYVHRGDAYLQLRRNGDALSDFNTAYGMTTDPRLRALIQKKREESAWTVYTVSDNLPSNDIQAVAIDGSHLWVGTAKGLAKFDVGLGTWQFLPEAGIESINELDTHVQLDVRALAVYSLKGNRPIAIESMSNDSVIDRPVDPPGVDALPIDDSKMDELFVEGNELWIGTLNHGVIRYSTKAGSFINYSSLNGLPHNQVFDIKFGTDDVWVGTFSGAARFSRATERWTVYNREEDGLPADDIVALAITPKTVWAGTSEAGIAVFDLAFDVWRSIDASELIPNVMGNSIVSFDVEGQDVFFTWYSKQEKSNGYGYVDWEGLGGEGFSVMQSADIVPVENIHVAVSGVGGEPNSPTLWIATNDGVYFRSAGSWDSIGYPVDQIGDSARINCIVLSADSAWIGTSNGLAKISANTLGVR